MNCYGKRHGRLAECATCELAEYCAEAGDPPLLNAMPLDEARLAEAVAEPRDEEDDGGDGKKMLAGESLVELVEVARVYPELWQVVREKLRDGSASLATVARRAGLKSKQLAHYRIIKFTQMCPLVFDALTIDRRFVNHRPSQQYTKPPTKRKKQWIATEAYQQPSLPGM